MGVIQGILGLWTMVHMSPLHESFATPCMATPNGSYTIPTHLILYLVVGSSGRKEGIATGII